MASIPFNNARGHANLLQMAPPFAFSDVTMSVFPLRASLPTLENFCRNYLNQAPDLVQFRPFIPYVYLVILDYGRMSVEAANMGWISQREVAFGVPLRWLNATSNGLEFHDWAFTSPFIFVDNELSMSTGREVFGWPKLLARLDPSVSEWVRDPHGARRVFQVSTKGAAEGYAGEMSAHRDLLSVYQRRTAGLLDIPPSLDAITKPVSQMSNMATSMARLSVELTKTFLGLASDRITGSAVLPEFGDMDTLKSQLEPEKLKAWLNAKEWSSGLQDSLWSLFPRMYANTINFKQFRDTANPESTCYQAITAAKMPVTSVKQGGFLGPQNMLLGQLDGGFHIEIHDMAGLPIVDSLGLEVESVRESNGSNVSTLMPVAPLWMKVDMTYGLGEPVIWRGRRNYWFKGAILEEAQKAADQRNAIKAKAEGQDAPVQADPAAQKQVADLSDTSDQAFAIDDTQSFDYLRAMNIFNTSRGASEAVGGSFNLPEASVRVLPLKADPQALQDFASNYLHIEGHLKFEAWGDYVYLLVNDFKKINSQQSALTTRSAREMTLLVPVKCYKWYSHAEYVTVGNWWDSDSDTRENHGRDRLLTTGFVNAFTYVDDVQTAITANEVFGVPSMSSSIDATENDWLSRDRGRRNVHERILNMHTKVLPELMAGAKAVDRTLIEVSGGWDEGAYSTIETKTATVNRWIELMANDLETKARESARTYGRGVRKVDVDQEQATAFGETFAMRLLAGDLPFNQFSLKQFRDSAVTSDACYQGLVQRRHTIRKINDVSELSGPLHVSITDYPTQPITKLLGLIPKFSYPGKDRIVHVFEPIRPFSFNGDLVRGSGMTLFERIGDADWQPVDLPEQIFGWRNLTPNEAERLWQDTSNTDEDDGEESADAPQKADQPDDLIEVGRDPLEREAKHFNKVIRTARPRVFKSWYKFRTNNKATDNIMIRKRNQPNTLRMFTAIQPPVFNKYNPQKSADIRTWLSHAQKQDEYRSSQDEVAGRMERISPATVIDKVLSRQWGKTENSKFYDVSYADFCLPVHTVPSSFEDTLFPGVERQGHYWPQSDAFQDKDNLRWRDETNAFRYELEASLRLLAQIYPQTVAEGNPDVADLTEPKQVFDYLAGRLNMLMEGTHTRVSEELIEKSLRFVENVDDEIGMMRTFEEMAFEFFEAHLPDTLQLRRVSLFKGSAMDVFLGPSVAESHLGPDDWLQVADGIETIWSKMIAAKEHAPPDAIGLETLANRARTNHDIMRRLDEDRSPAEILRDRLKEMMSGL